MGLFSIATVLDLITSIILACGLILGIIQYAKLEIHFKMLFFYLLLSLTANFGMKLMAEYFGNNLILIPLFGLLELILFTILYAFYMKLRHLRYLILGIGLVGSMYILYELGIVKTANPSEFQSYARAVDAFIIVLFSMIYFFDKLSKGTDLHNSVIQLNTLILVFFSLNLIFLLPMNFLVGENSNNLKFYFWIAFNGISALFYIIITFSIWKNGRTQRRLRSGLRS